MKLKTVEIEGKSYAEMKDGAILFIADDGKEIAYTDTAITRLSGEAMGHRKRFEAAEQRAKEFEDRVKAFEGIDDPDAARKALEFQKNVKDGEFIAAGKAEEMKAGLTRTFEEKYGAQQKSYQEKIGQLQNKLSDVSGKYDQEVVGNAFANSKFIREKTAVPLRMLQATFGAHFKNDEGRVVGRHANGEPIIATNGEPAAFDEAFERIIEAFPDRDMIMKGTGASGTGARAGHNGNGGAGKTITRAQFEAMAPMQKHSTITSGVTVVD